MYILFLVDLGFLDLNDAIAPVKTLGQGVDAVSEEILIDIGFPTFNSLDLHTAAYVSQPVSLPGYRSVHPSTHLPTCLLIPLPVFSQLICILYLCINFKEVAHNQYNRPGESN